MNEDLPREVTKPWGSECWYARTDRYAGKILRVTEGHKRDLPKDDWSRDTWVVGEC
ncbi:MAG TPA: hypothetical protein VIJ66_00560 [Solirubrobacteraceae bacterium]